MTPTATETSSSTEAKKEVKKGPAATKVGNLTADPELLYSKAGKAYARMRIAVSTPKVEGDWSGERTTVFYDVTAFGSVADHAAESLKKGDRVLVTGKGEVREWTGADGQVHSSKGIIADAIGPDLRWASVTVERVQRAEATTPTPNAAPEYDDEPF